MKWNKNITIVSMCVFLMIPSGCSTFKNMSQTGQNAIIGGGAGAAVGTGIGALIGGGKGAWIGALVGGALGAGTGAAIGYKMDKQKEELERELASVKELAAQRDTTYIIESVKDSNNLNAIKVVLGDAILFNIGSAQLSAIAQAALSRIAYNLNQNPSTDMTIIGYTDNTGTYGINMQLSQERADAVRNYLISQGVSASRLSAVGKGWDNPIASNTTLQGRTQNRRVEMYITASKEMIQNAM